MENPRGVFWVGLWRERQAILLPDDLCLLVNILSNYIFHGLGACLSCPGRISKPVGAENPGTGTCYGFLWQSHPWNFNYLIFTLLHIYIS